MMKITIEKDEEKRELNFDLSGIDTKDIEETHGIDVNNELCKFMVAEILGAVVDLIVGKKEENKS